MEGRIIAIEGCDGVGKETQAKLLSKTLTKRGIINRIIHFPTYGTESAIPVEIFLQGKLKDLSPVEISMLFALNRSVELRKLNIEEKVEAGEFFIFDRYVSSNIITNAANLKKKKYRKDFAARIAALEFGILSLPEPNIEIYLDMSFENMMDNLKKRNADSKEKDINERNVEFLKKSNKVGRQIAKWGGMHIIHCNSEDGKLRPIEDIHNEIVDRLFSIDKENNHDCAACSEKCEKKEENKE